MKPTKRILGLLMAVVCAIQTFAQTMTYNHDASKCGQIQVMELGAGALTPDWYYSVMHHSYKKGAKNATSVKNTLRMATNVASLPQVEYADSIKADLESRAKIEAANIADRQIDLAWPVPYTPLTLPTIYSVSISVVAVSLKKKNIIVTLILYTS